MKGKVAILRLSPNEEDRIIREEYERRRKLRIQQVREQQRCIASKIRREVEKRRQHELEQLGKELKDQWEREQRAKISRLQKVYQENLQLLGQGQRSAKENEPDWAAIAQKKEDNHAKAEERFQEALKELKLQKLKEYERQSRTINARKKALEAEKERSARVASLPLPPPNPLQNMDFKKPHRIQMTDVNAFATTYYHMAERIVDREVDPIKPNAHEEAEVQLERRQLMEMEKMRRREEQLEKAYLRGKQALRREHLEQDCERLLVELEHRQQTDQLRRRQRVAKMPPQIFQPPYKRAEMKEDFQRQMEFAFKDACTEERRVKGDVAVQLVPEPPPDWSTGSQDQELDVTLDDVAPGTSGTTQPGTEQGAGTSEQVSSTQEEQRKPPPKHPLKKLLDRIRSQRSQWTEHEAAVDVPAVRTDEVPEEDTTIDTGSLGSEEKSSQLPGQLHKTTLNEPQTSEQPTAADTQLPDERSKRHEERKKRDEELERKKLEQLALLQELEGQKAELEQMLKSLQERKGLHITHQDQPESFISDHEDSSAEATHITLPPDEDDHAIQLGAYQCQLLERNRIHQRYVEVARERLEEYRRTLQMRYEMAAEKGLPPPPPHLCTQSSQAAADLSHLTTSALQTSSHDRAQTSRVIPTGESVPAWDPRPPDTGSVPGVESFLSDARYQTIDVVAERLRDRLKPVSVTREPRRESPIQTTGPGIPAMPVQTGALPQDSVCTLSVGPIEDPVSRQTEEQQDRHAWEVESMRQQRQYLQALIDIDSQTEPLTEATPTEDVGHVRRGFLESLLKVIEQRNGGTLSHLEAGQSDTGEAPDQSGMLPQCSMLDEPLSPQEEMKDTLDQREPGDLCSEEEEDQGLDKDMEFRRRREMSQPLPEPAPEQLLSEDIGQIRLKLFASLLKAIAERNQGTLSQSETAQKEDKTAFSREAISQSGSAGPPSASIQPEGLWVPPQATRPPVTRIKSAVWEMSRQHQLSAIPEVETPVNTSLVTGLETSPSLPSGSVDQDSLEDSTWARLKSCGQQILEQSMSSETSSGSSSHLVWTEKRLSLSESSPQRSVADSKMTSPLSSDSGRGADYSGPAATTFTSLPEAAHGAAGPESDSLSATTTISTTISTGSYITTDPEQNSDESPSLVRVGREAELLAVFSPPTESICSQDGAAAGSPHLAVERLFSDSGIQRIIDKYTKELNFSLSSPGRATECGGLSMQAVGASAVLDVERTERSPVSEPVLSDNAEAQGSSPQWARADSPVQEQDSFRPLIGQPADQSSCLPAEQRDSAIEVGQPWAHSSLIGLQFSLDHSGWDSTLTRMMGQFAHQSMWQTGGRGHSDLPTMGQLSEHLTTWLGGAPEESQMEPLVEELDESAGQQMESSGERTLVDLGGAAEVTAPSQPEIPPAASVLEAPPQAQTVPAEEGPERIEAWDSFQPLMAEVTHNETADASVTFPQPEHSSPGELPSSRRPPDAPSESERSLDFFRATDAAPAVMTPHQSFSLLVTSQDHVHQSVLASPRRDAPAGGTSQAQEAVGSASVEPLTSEGGAGVHDAAAVSEQADEKGILEQSQITLVSLTDTSLHDQEAALADEAGCWDEHPDVETESMLAAQPHDESQTLPATLLEVDLGLGRGQRKLKALLQRSSQRVQELRSKRAQRGSEREKLEKSCQPQAWSPATVDTRPKTSPARRSQTAVGSSLRKTPQAEAPEVELRICTTERRKLELSEMHQRTRRLYQQLEEVQQQKAVKSRQEASTQNRLKAKEFHKKTLQKLRAKSTPR